MNSVNVSIAQNFLSESARLMGSNVSEDVLRHHLSSFLPRIFPEQPWWITYHVQGTEQYVRFDRGGAIARGFIDALVGATAIEYEKDLTKADLFEHGLGQVKDYCAGLLNQGVPQAHVLGVLSDTLRWYVYRVKEVHSLGTVTGATSLGRDHLELEEVDFADLSGAGPNEARLFVEFLIRHLGREEARSLGAETLAFDLGFDSPFCHQHIDGIRVLATSAFTGDQGYADLIKKLWTDFVAYIGGTHTTGDFDLDTYIQELYILTLSKLLCANILENRALLSDDTELTSILNGGFFRQRGFNNLVEYDYFGWLNASPYVEQLLPVAREIQDDLRAYDFASAPVEDLFGKLMAQLAQRSQRILLGQEWTPTWLAERVVERVLQGLPEDEDPRLVDMCCGSGAMIIAAVKAAKKRLNERGVSATLDGLKKLSEVITGFDIDPLAVMLSKVGWILAARDWLSGQDTGDIALPIYHADSLFSATPLTRNVDSNTEATPYQLRLDDRTVELPTFLVSADHRLLFDALLDRGYEMAMVSASNSSSTLNSQVIDMLVRRTIADVGDTLTLEQQTETGKFCKSLMTSLEMLQRAGRNGVWAFVLRNSYRPGLVVGQFNGLVSNPPWLALSKIADNPYKEFLRRRAVEYGIKPEGPSHLHIELATTFLLHAVERYLTANATLGCILPESILSAHHHNRFRRADYLHSSRSVALSVQEIWRVAKGTFKNEAIVVFGEKSRPAITNDIPGKSVSARSVEDLTFTRISRGTRTAWTDRPELVAGRQGGLFDSGSFSEGADIMPRTAIFHRLSRVPGSTARWNVEPIDRVHGNERYLIKGARSFQDIQLTARGLDDAFVYEVLTSTHLSPFDLCPPAKAVLPLQRNQKGDWIGVSMSEMATFGRSTAQTFQAIFGAIGRTSEEQFQRLNVRNKLRKQKFSNGWLVVTSAGGSIPCAAFVDLSKVSADKLIIDQTLYWAEVATEEEAVYWTGLLNSKAVKTIIQEFQPRGQFGARHIHTLATSATPPFEPSDTVHSEVVGTTKRLMDEWDTLKNTDSTIEGLLHPNVGLVARRRQLRNAIQNLSSYDDYELACQNLYGV